MTDKTPPLVSVVMPVYDREKYVAEAIESILGQTFSDFELIIVDDGSQDRSPEIIREYERQDGRVRLLRQEGNMGVATARNRGIDEAGGEFLALMDSDDISLPTRLVQQLSFLQENPEIGAVGVRSKMVNHDLTVQFGINAGRRLHAPIVLSLLTGVVALVTGGLMIRSQPLRTVGGFTDGLRDGEEADLYIRLLVQTRIRFANLPEILYVQRLHDSNLSSSNLSRGARHDFTYERWKLNALWDEVTDDTLMRFRRLRLQDQLNWSERRAAKADLRRLIASLIERKMVDPSERPLLIAEMNRRLEQTCPRLWQKICHWRRHHFGPGKWEKAVWLD
ncbi:MAG: glycosyltransferase family 2 protein [Chloroflexi bacterium]|nr:glycosyltransferase family 2 protein [Chloroflexota bacterium]